MDRFGDTTSVPELGSNLVGDGARSYAGSLVGSWGGSFAQLRAYHFCRDSPFAPYDADPAAAAYSPTTRSCSSRAATRASSSNPDAVGPRVHEPLRVPRSHHPAGRGAVPRLRRGQDVRRRGPRPLRTCSPTASSASPRGTEATTTRRTRSPTPRATGVRRRSRAWCRRTSTSKVSTPRSTVSRRVARLHRRSALRQQLGDRSPAVAARRRVPREAREVRPQAALRRGLPQPERVRGVLLRQHDFSEPAASRRDDPQLRGACCGPSRCRACRRGSRRSTGMRARSSSS